MATIDLTATRPTPGGLLEALPRRVTLTLPELQVIAEFAGGAPLPFDIHEPGGAPPLKSRLGASPGTTEDQAYLAVIEALPDPVQSLTRRGLIVDGVAAAGVIGAVGLLATPTAALDIDVAVGSSHVKAWHRQAGEAVASLATSDGIVFELAWFSTTAWPNELARIAVLPEDHVLEPSAVPDDLDLPFELADAAVEADHDHRADLLDVLVTQSPDALRDRTGRPVAEATVALGAVATEARGRLRVLVADVSRGATAVAGVRSWVLLADGWRSLHPHHETGQARVTLARVSPIDLAADLAPVLAQLAASGSAGHQEVPV